MNAVLKCLSQAASVLTCCSLALNAQTSGVSTKTINIERFQKDTPLYVVAFRMGDEVKHVVPRSNAATFESGNDWLRHVSITVQNACNKTMTGVVVHLDFPDTESVPMNRVRLAHEFHFGATPQRSMYRQDGTALRALPAKEPLSVAPRGRFQIPLESEFETMRNSLQARQSLETINSVWVRFMAIYFSDGSRWVTGTFQVPDPSDEKKYINASPEDFQCHFPSNLFQD